MMRITTLNLFILGAFLLTHQVAGEQLLPFCQSQKYLDYVDQLKQTNQTDLLTKAEFFLLANCTSSLPNRLLENDKHRKLVGGSPDVDNGDFSNGFTSWTNSAEGSGGWIIQDPSITSYAGFAWSPPPLPSQRVSPINCRGYPFLA